MVAAAGKGMLRVGHGRALCARDAGVVCQKRSVLYEDDIQAVLLGNQNPKNREPYARNTGDA